METAELSEGGLSMILPFLLESEFLVLNLHWSAQQCPRRGNNSPILNARTCLSTVDLKKFPTRQIPPHFRGAPTHQRPVTGEIPLSSGPSAALQRANRQGESPEKGCRFPPGSIPHIQSLDLRIMLHLALLLCVPSQIVEATDFPEATQ